jgi:hypothetical protein
MKMDKQTDGAEPHFKVGVAGRLARFFIARRAAGDPFDATLVLPCAIFLVLARLNDLGRVDARAVIAGLVIPTSIAGFWIGAALGSRGQGRAMLRAVLVGAIEGAASVAIANEILSKPEAIKNALNLMYINLVFFWFFSMITARLSDIFVQSEREWQIVLARRAKIRRSMHGVAGFVWYYTQPFAIRLYEYITKELFKAVLNAIVGVIVLYKAPELIALAYAFIRNHLPFW